ncbi:hypothetical protein CLOHYLEM_06495 [[Clostridium] hylemonae DSM 15053]|uniref:Uncharacterized protein n=1 Tax=[Clostridium] hylemonae DSM 15053 TaxID=553973 RepID=C0C335_9FIRM|nr:hypothetical protein CLOHYLEM_06495 [[Clostridium] hylemonae DSM 15053]
MFFDWRWTAKGRVHRGVKERSGSRVSVTAERAGIRQPSLFGMKS